MSSLSPDLVKPIQASCQALLALEPQFQREFRDSLIELMPDDGMMRGAAGHQVSQSLVSCVLWAVSAEEPADFVVATLQHTGMDAHQRGFPRAGYQSVGHALLRSVRAVYPGDWTGTLSSSWIGYHAWLCEHWLAGADAAIASGVVPVPQAGDDGEPEPEASPEIEVAIADGDPSGAGHGEVLTSAPTGASRLLRRRDNRRRSAENRND